MYAMNVPTCFMYCKFSLLRIILFNSIMFESREPNARIKVLDFGLSKKFMPGSREIMTEWVGTVYTMAPQVLHGIYDSKADCW